MTLIDPAILQPAADDAPLADRLEAVARSTMAARCRLKHKPGTHAEQADMVAELDVVLDRWLEVTATNQ